jgi:hypothetical protein
MGANPDPASRPPQGTLAEVSEEKLPEAGMTASGQPYGSC